MKKILFFLSITALVFTACNDDNDSVSFEEQRNIDIAKIEKYLTDSSLIAQVTETGLHYIIEVEGTGNYPTIDSSVSVNYTGMYLDGEVFDAGNIDGDLKDFILGWQEGIPFFKEGGSGKLFIPSSLGYGVYGWGPIPGNAVLIFEVELISVDS